MFDLNLSFFSKLPRILGFCLAAILLLAAALLLLPVASEPAGAQTSTPSISPFLRSGPQGRSQNGVEISVSYQFFIEGAAETLDAQAKLSDQGRRALYTMLANECQVLLETIAQTCEISRANVNSQINQVQTRRKGIRVSGAATYRIAFKAKRDAAQ